ncbi:MAG: hypothetical protein O3B24_05325 [Verrucomicrobia bacterium]|nr:hypothetical protein [Verrucomicrobiota bacterium]
MHLGRCRVQVLAAMLLVAFSACFRKPPESPPPPRPPPLPHPTAFSFTDTNQVVAASEIPSEGRQPLVRADFNFDRLTDVAVAETNESGQSVVTIYLRRRSGLLDERYVKAGGILQSGDYTISGLMTSGNGEHTDLVVIFAFMDGHKELVHFRSDGSEFKEVLRQSMAGAGSASAP